MFMPKRSTIPNKRPITLVGNAELILKAQELGLNISQILDSAMEKEINPSSQKAYTNAVATKLHNLEAWLIKNQLEEAYYEDKSIGGKKNVLEEEERPPTREDRENKGSVGGI